MLNKTVLNCVIQFVPVVWLVLLVSRAIYVYFVFYMVDYSHQFVYSSALIKLRKPSRI